MIEIAAIVLALEQGMQGEDRRSQVSEIVAGSRLDPSEQRKKMLCVRDGDVEHVLESGGHGQVEHHGRPPAIEQFDLLRSKGEVRNGVVDVLRFAQADCPVSVPREVGVLGRVLAQEWFEAVGPNRLEIQRDQEGVVEFPCRGVSRVLDVKNDMDVARSTGVDCGLCVLQRHVGADLRLPGLLTYRDRARGVYDSGDKGREPNKAKANLHIGVVGTPFSSLSGAPLLAKVGLLLGLGGLAYGLIGFGFTFQRPKVWPIAVGGLLLLGAIAIALISTSP